MATLKAYLPADGAVKIFQVSWASPETVETSD
jgi:hypothetical protein